MDGVSTAEGDYWSGLWSGHRVREGIEEKEPFSWSLSLFANEEYPSALGATSPIEGDVNVLQGRWNPRTKQVCSSVML
jgi:hypothetical protein